MSVCAKCVYGLSPEAASRCEKDLNQLISELSSMVSIINFKLNEASEWKFSLRKTV